MTSPASSSLSSFRTDITDHEELESSIRAKLASYQPEDANDPFITILKSFFECLPRDGALNLSDDIIGCGSDKELRSLANTLLTAVLVPSEYSLLYMYI